MFYGPVSGTVPRTQVRLHLTVSNNIANMEYELDTFQAHLLEQSKLEIDSLKARIQYFTPRYGVQFSFLL